MTLTHILFDLYGTLSDSRRMYPCYAQQVGRILAEHYGGVPSVWADANRQIALDWDSYYVDLDLTGDHGLDDLWEGQFRTTRALFRLTGIAEPEMSALQTLSRELPYLATRGCDTLYPDSKTAIEVLHEAGFILGIASHTTTLQARGTLEGAGMLDYFRGPILGPDVTGRFAKDREFYTTALRGELTIDRFVVVEDAADGVLGAKAAGMRTVYVERVPGRPLPPADHVLRGDLSGLLAVLRG